MDRTPARRCHSTRPELHQQPGGVMSWLCEFEILFLQLCSSWFWFFQNAGSFGFSPGSAAPPLSPSASTVAHQQQKSCLYPCFSSTASLLLVSTYIFNSFSVITACTNLLLFLCPLLGPPIFLWWGDIFLFHLWNICYKVLFSVLVNEKHW